MQRGRIRILEIRTFFPLRVERDLNIFGKKEKIIEFYESQKGRVRIIKSVEGGDTETIIEKKGDVDNIYCFIYRCRKNNRFRIGDTMNINLPTKDVSVSLVKKMELKAARQIFDTFYMRSTPSQYNVWFDSGDEKIPLRIDGAVGFGNTSMIMTKREAVSPLP